MRRQKFACLNPASLKDMSQRWQDDGGGELAGPVSADRRFCGTARQSSKSGARVRTEEAGNDINNFFKVGLEFPILNAEVSLLDGGWRTRECPIPEVKSLTRAGRTGLHAEPKSENR